MVPHEISFTAGLVFQFCSLLINIHIFYYQSRDNWDLTVESNPGLSKRLRVAGEVGKSQGRFCGACISAGMLHAFREACAFVRVDSEMHLLLVHGFCWNLFLFLHFCIVLRSPRHCPAFRQWLNPSITLEWSTVKLPLDLALHFQMLPSLFKMIKISVNQSLRYNDSYYCFDSSSLMAKVVQENFNVL